MAGMYLRAINEEKLTDNEYISSVLKRNFDKLLEGDNMPMNKEENDPKANVIMSIFLNQVLLDYSKDLNAKKRLKENQKEIDDCFVDSNLKKFKRKEQSKLEYLESDNSFLVQKNCEDEGILIDFIKYDKDKEKELISRLNSLIYSINTYNIDEKGTLSEETNYDYSKSYYIYYSLVYFKNYCPKKQLIDEKNYGNLDDYLDNMRKGIKDNPYEIFRLNAENNFNDKNPYGKVCERDEIEVLKDYKDILNFYDFKDDEAAQKAKELISKLQILYDDFMDDITKEKRKKAIRDSCMDFLKDNFKNIESENKNINLKVTLENSLDDVEQLIELVR